MSIRITRTFYASLAIVVLLAGMAPAARPSDEASDLEAAFAKPPDSAKPWVYWFWLNGNITRDGITADLEAMKRAGIGGVLIMEVDQGVPEGPVAFMSEPWRELFGHVVAEAQRLGLEVNMNNDAGWNGSGGPWIKPEQSMQKVVWSETDVEGPRPFDGALPQPETVAGFYQDIRVVAFPTSGPFQIDNIQVKACYQTGVVGALGETSLPPETAIAHASIVDLSGQMDTHGRLVWDIPPGKWTVMRFGHTSTGVENAPAPASGRGLECDKLSREGIEANFAGMMGKLIADAGPAAGRTLVATHIDSWENGAQNWTPHMREEFQARRGYDPLPFLPVLTGRVIESLDISERFLWDFRQTISDLIVENYAGHLQALAHEHGMRLSIEAYGGPCDDLPYAGRADEPMCEFWVGGGGFPTCKGMASAAHTYGKPIVGAEAFTAADQERWLEHPATIKSLGDRAFCDGVNRFVFHRYAMQPWRDRRPGMTMGPWGIHYERTETWWDMTPAWHSYLARCQYLLRQGLFVADIVYLQPEAAPQDFPEHKRQGYDYDSCSAEVVLTRMKVDQGRLVLPDGMSYRLLVLPDVNTLTPALLTKIKDLVHAGATVVGPRPVKSPSLSGYPQCDEQVKQLASELWGDCDGKSVKEHPYGAGRVMWGAAPETVLAEAGVRPDFTSGVRLGYIHRVVGDADLYFVANPQPFDVRAVCAFRVSGKAPELWWPDSGRTERAAVFAEKDGGTSVALSLGPNGSVFVVFRKDSALQDPIVAVMRDGKVILSATDTIPAVVVSKAVYGVLNDPRLTRDVTAEVQQLARKGDLSFPVSRMAESGDPAPSVVKTLAIEYTIEDRQFTVTGNDNDTIHLTGEAGPIVVMKAVYGVPGDPQRTRDVRAKVQHIVDTGESSFQVARLAQGDDPAFGIVKTLVVEYTIAGKLATATGSDPDMIVMASPTPSERVAEICSSADGRLVLEAWQAGQYELRTASGPARGIEIKALPQPLEVSGPWYVHFPPNWGAPEQIALERLISWSEHSDLGVKYFSGVGTYSSTFVIPDELLGHGRRLYLDLGEVWVMALAKLNDKDLGVLWKPPFRVDVTECVKPGENRLEIAVANSWVNRLIGDEQLPEDSERNPNGTLKAWPEWLTEDRPSPTGRYTFTTWRLWSKDAPLQKSGLLGPVTLRSIPTAPVER